MSEDQIQEELKSRRPTPEEQQRLKREHLGHLVRHTESEYTIDVPSPDGVEIDITAEVPDIYCFTCEEWIGISGIDLRGTPRSQEDAFYLGRKPREIRTAHTGTLETLEELTDQLQNHVDRFDREDALSFIEARLAEIDADDSTGSNDEHQDC